MSRKRGVPSSTPWFASRNFGVLSFATRMSVRLSRSASTNTRPSAFAYGPPVTGFFTATPEAAVASRKPPAPSFRRSVSIEPSNPVGGP